MTGIGFPKPVRAPKAPRKPLRSRSPMKRGEGMARSTLKVVTSTLKVVTPLKRKAWMKRRPPRRLDTAQSNPAFLAWVRGEPCCVRSFKCSGPIEAHHAGKNPGIGLKAPDDTAVPLCQKHHRELTDHSGMFKSVAREVLRAWQDNWIGATYSRWLSAGSRRSK